MNIHTNQKSILKFLIVLTCVSNSKIKNSYLILYCLHHSEKEKKLNFYCNTTKINPGAN